jgi:hypothetical protein
MKVEVIFEVRFKHLDRSVNYLAEKKSRIPEKIVGPESESVRSCGASLTLGKAWMTLTLRFTWHFWRSCPSTVTPPLMTGT